METSWHEQDIHERRYYLRIIFITGMVLFILGAALAVLIMRARKNAPQIVVSINGHNIDRAAFVQQLEMATGPYTLHDMVNDELQLQFAAKKGITVDAKQVEAKFAADAMKPDFSQRLQRNHQTPELYKRHLRVQQATTAVLTQGVQVTDAEVQRFYQAQTAKNNLSALYYTPETIQIRIIVTATEARAQAAMKELTASAPFEEVASRYSMDSSRTRGGLIPPIGRGRTKVRHVPGLEDAIFALKVGEQWGPRRFDNSWWIVRCVDRIPERTAPFDEVKADCRERALVAKALPLNGNRVTAEYADFKRHSTIQAFEPQYANAVRVE